MNIDYHAFAPGRRFVTHRSIHRSILARTPPHHSPILQFSSSFLGLQYCIKIASRTHRLKGGTMGESPQNHTKVRERENALIPSVNHRYPYPARVIKQPLQPFFPSKGGTKETQSMKPRLCGRFQLVCAPTAGILSLFLSEWRRNRRA